MGYKLIKQLEAMNYNRLLFYLDGGPEDLPPIVDRNSIQPGSVARSLTTDDRWILDTSYQWIHVTGGRVLLDVPQSPIGGEYVRTTGDDGRGTWTPTHFVDKDYYLLDKARHLGALAQYRVLEEDQFAFDGRQLQTLSPARMLVNQESDDHQVEEWRVPNISEARGIQLVQFVKMCYLNYNSPSHYIQVGFGLMQAGSVATQHLIPLVLYAAPPIPWSPYDFYHIGQVVKHNDRYYTCIQKTIRPVNAGQTTPPDQYPQLWEELNKSRVDELYDYINQEISRVETLLNNFISTSTARDVLQEQWIKYLDAKSYQYYYSQPSNAALDVTFQGFRIELAAGHPGPLYGTYTDPATGQLEDFSYRWIHMITDGESTSLYTRARVSDGSTQRPTGRTQIDDNTAWGGDYGLIVCDLYIVCRNGAAFRVTVTITAQNASWQRRSVYFQRLDQTGNPPPPLP